MGGISDDHHPVVVPGRYSREVVGRPAGHDLTGGPNDVDRRCRVVGEEPAKLGPPMLRRDGGNFRPGGLSAPWWIREPPDSAGRVQRIAEEAALSEDHLHRARTA